MAVDTPPRRPVALAATAALIVLAAFGGLLVLGALRPPAFAALADAADPRVPGMVAFWDARDSGCLSVVDAGGGPVRRLRCDQAAYPVDLEWTADGNLTFERYVRDREERVTVDPRSGAVLDQQIVESSREPSRRPDLSDGPDGTAAVIDGADGTALLRLVPPSGRPRTLLEVRGPRDYAFSEAAWSEDGRWLLVADSEQRLLVVDADTGEARLLATDATLAAWSHARTPSGGPV